MKIAIIHNIFQPETRGGAEVVVSNIAQGLKNHGHNVFVITASRDKANQEDLIDGIKIYRPGYLNFFSFFDLSKEPEWLRFFWHPFDMFNFVQFWSVYNILKTTKPDLVLTHNLKGIGYLTRLVIWLLGIKNIHTIHDAQLIHPSGLVAGDGVVGLAAKVYAFVCKILFGSPEVVIFPSQYILALYDNYDFFPRSEKIVLGNPIMASVNNLPAVERQGSLNFLFLGQVEAYKGIFDLISAFKKITGGVYLHVVGSGSALELAKTLVGEDKRIKFYGQMSPEELEKNIWPLVDVLINPSQVAESFGLVITEAYAHGLPVLVAKIGALAELVKAQETGWLFSAGDSIDLGKKIEAIIAQKDQLPNYRQQCFLEAKKYSLESYLNKLLEFAKIEEK